MEQGYIHFVISRYFFLLQKYNHYKIRTLGRGRTQSKGGKGFGRKTANTCSPTCIFTWQCLIGLPRLPPSLPPESSPFTFPPPCTRLTKAVLVQLQPILNLLDTWNLNIEKGPAAEGRVNYISKKILRVWTDKQNQILRSWSETKCKINSQSLEDTHVGY